MSAAVTPQSIPTGIPTPAELGFDPADLRQKYAAERTKRLREDANNQYQEITGQYAHYNEDPYVEPGFTRPELHEELDVEQRVVEPQRGHERVNARALAEKNPLRRLPRPSLQPVADAARARLQRHGRFQPDAAVGAAIGHDIGHSEQRLGIFAAMGGG